MTFHRLKISPHTAAPSKEVISNIKRNMELIPTWLEKCAINSEIAVIASAGPSLEKYMKDFDRYNKAVFCVKHSLKRLVNLGITPDFCVLLDGRDANENSTLGYNRLELIKDAPKETTFLVASMAHPAYAEYLLENGYKVIGWHALVKELQEIPGISYAISGGTCSTVRAIGIAHTMGFRASELYGVDSSFEEGSCPKDRVLEVYVGPEDNKTGPIYTTGELAAQAQDIERLIKDEGTDIRVSVLCDGLVGEVMRHLDNKTHKKFYWEVYDIE